MQAIWSASQIQGARDYQEDFLAIVENNTIFSIANKQEIAPDLLPAHQSLYLLADGMGGMGHGDIAASAVVDVFCNSFLAQQQLGMTVADNLRESLLTANQEISNQVKQNPELKKELSGSAEKLDEWAKEPVQPPVTQARMSELLKNATPAY